MNDDDLIRAAQGGDQAALGELYQRYLTPVWRYVCARVGRNYYDVEDVVSETILGAVRNIDRFDIARGTFYSWLVGIATNKINNFYREKKNGESDRAIGPPVEGKSEPEVEKVRKILLGLDANERLVLEWKYLEGLSVRDIAQRLGRTEKAIQALLYRAREHCRNGDGGMQSQA